MAGGKGTRLASVTGDLIPKPMVKIAGLPLLEYQIRLLIRYHVEEIIIIVGFLGESIKAYFADGSRLGIKIRYIEEKHARGTGGSLRFLSEIINEDFLLIFGDLLADISISKMLEFHKEKKALVTLFAHPNSHPYDSDLLLVNEGDIVIGYSDKKDVRDRYFRNLVNAGVYIVSPVVFTKLPEREMADLERDIVFPLCGMNSSVFAYRSSEYVRDIGTPERLLEAEKDMQNGIVAAKNLDNYQKCVFLDRDGTLNRLNGLVYKSEQLALEEGVTEAVKAINKSVYLAVVITNQPVVARGLCSETDVAHIHHKLETLLGEKGAYVDGIYYCPHHPDRGFERENLDYKIPCHCRKPDTGMIEESVRRFNIDTKESYMVGDTTVDIQMGKNAGLKTILVLSGEGGRDKKYAVKSDYVCRDLREAVNIIVNDKEK